jgi:hypothetical protein
MNTSAGGGKSSAYMTFRVMSEKSSGWIVPAQPGQFLAQKVQQAIGPQAQTLFSKAIALDLKKGS